MVSLGVCTMNDTSGQLYTINSVKVQFPWKAYPSQLSMMDKVRISYAVCLLHILEKLPSIEVGPTTLAWSITLTFNAVLAMVMTYSHAKVQGQKPVSSEDRVETNG